MQDHYNLLNREEEREMLPLCADQGVGVIPWSPLARGRLTRDWDEETARSQTDEFGRRNVLASFDASTTTFPGWRCTAPKARSRLPDPNSYDGDVLLKRRTDDGWRVLPPVIPDFAEPGTADQYLRGPGVADLVAALDGARSGPVHRSRARAGGDRGDRDVRLSTGGTARPDRG